MHFARNFLRFVSITDIGATLKNLTSFKILGFRGALKIKCLFKKEIKKYVTKHS
jgi:hypothetical protein